MNGDGNEAEATRLDSVDNKRRIYDLSDDFFSLSKSYDDEPSEKRMKLEEEVISSPTKSELDTDEDSKVVSLDNESKLEPKNKLTSPLFDSDEDEPIVPSIPQPSLDREAIRLKIAERIRAQSGLLEDDLEEEELEVISPVKVIAKTEASNDIFSDSNEKNRKYLIRVTSKLPIPKQFTQPYIDFGAKGTKKFSRILASINKHCVDQFKPLDPAVIKHYNPLHTCLIWVEGKMEIKPFFKLSTLRIPPPDLDIDTTLLNCILIPKSHATTFLTEYPEFQSKIVVEDDNDVAEVPYIDSSDDDGGVINEVAETVVVEDAEDNFVIGLKGKDNKRIEVRVSPTTKIMNLLTHFCTIANIDIRTIDLKQAKLIFDDEELDLNDVVGNTELEEDFEVQVVI